MNKKIVIIAFFVTIVVVSLLFFGIKDPQRYRFAKGPDVEFPEIELGRTYDEHDTILIGRVIRNVEAGEFVDSSNGRSKPILYKKFNATIKILMKVKGEIDAHAISFDYYGEKYNNGYSHLLVDQIILYTPLREPLKYPVVAEPYFVLDMSGGALVWYENIDFKKGAEILKFLGYRAYSKQIAMQIFKQFYGDITPSETTLIIKTNSHGWLFQGKCDRLFGWGCSQKEFCYSVSFMTGALSRCRSDEEGNLQ